MLLKLANSSKELIQPIPMDSQVQTQVQFSEGSLPNGTRETEETSSYTAKFLQGPPPLIPDYTPISILPDSRLQNDVRRVRILKPPIIQAAPPSNMSLRDIPGVYFGYQIQEDYRQLQQAPTALQEMPPQPTTELVAVEEPKTSDIEVQEEKETVSTPVADSKIPPPLIPTSSLIIYPKQGETFSKQPEKSPPVLNFVQLQVLSTINGSASSIPPNCNIRATDIDLKNYPNLVETTGYVPVDIDGFRPVPTLVSNEEKKDYRNTGIQQKSLNSYEQNLMKDLHVQSSKEHYTIYNSNTVSTISNAISNPTVTHVDHHFSQLNEGQIGYPGRKRRQKKTREEKLAYLRQYARDRRARETPEQREARLADLRARQRARKANETPVQRKLRLEKDRLKTGRYRAKKRQDDVERTVVFTGSTTGPYTLSS